MLPVKSPNLIPRSSPTAAEARHLPARLFSPCGEIPDPKCRCTVSGRRRIGAAIDTEVEHENYQDGS